MNIDKSTHKILFISSGASVTGVPVYFINLIGWLKANTGLEITILTAFSGPLEKEYVKLAPVYKWDGTGEPSVFEKYYLFRLFRRGFRRLFGIKGNNYQNRIISELRSKNFDLVYINSVCSLWIFEQIREQLKLKVILHVHELQMSILQFCGDDMFRRNVKYADRIIVISEAVRQNLIKRYSVAEELMTLIYTFVDFGKAEMINTLKQKVTIKELLRIPEKAFIVVSSGTTDWRKGADLIVHIAKKVFSKTDFPVHFIWLGGDDSGLDYQKLYYDLEKLNLQDRIHFLGVKENFLEYLAVADVFMLPSREEPVGIVGLEAAALGIPVLCFDQAGGLPDFVGEDCGFVIPYLHLDAMAEQIIHLLNNRVLLKKLGENALIKVKQHDINIACREIEILIKSVIES